MEKKSDQNKLVKVASYSSYFADKKQGFYTVSKQVSMDPYEYAPTVDSFMRDLRATDLLIDFDWSSWKDDFQLYENDLSRIKAADLNVLKKLLTVIVRGGKFNAGMLAKAIDNGMLLAILQRLGELLKSWGLEVTPRAVPAPQGANEVLAALQFDPAKKKLERRASSCFALLFLLLGLFLFTMTKSKSDFIATWQPVEVIDSMDALQQRALGDDVIMPVVLPVEVESAAIQAAAPSFGVTVLQELLKEGYVMGEKYRVELDPTYSKPTGNRNRRVQVFSFFPDLVVNFAGNDLPLATKGVDMILPDEKKYDSKGREAIIDSVDGIVYSGFKGASTVTVFGKKSTDAGVGPVAICGGDKEACLDDTAYYKYVSAIFAVLSIFLAYLMWRYARKLKG